MKTLDISQIHPILGSIRSTALPARAEEEAAAGPPRFVTISRQGGAGGWTLAQNLAARLNQVDPGARPWSCWDRELVEKVASDHHISTELVESLERGGRNWLGDFLGGLAQGGGPSEFVVYRLVASTIRALAQAGRVVICGRGGMCITRGMPGGVHIRLVAPLKWRTEWFARKMNISVEESARQIRELDHARERFYHTFWPREALSAESFTATLNTAHLAEEQLVNCVVPMVCADARVGMQRLP